MSASPLKHTACLIAVLAYSCTTGVIGGAARADTATATAACDTELVAADAADESLNAAGDALGDAASVGLLPVFNAGWDEQFNQINANLGTLEGSLLVIQQAACQVAGVVAYPPGPSLLPALDLDLFGQDATPDPAALPAEVDGLGETLASDDARLADRETTALLDAAETSLTTDPERKLAEDAVDGLENEQGVAMQGIANDKLIKAQMSTLKDRIKAAANMQDLLATEGVVQIGMLDALRDINENLALTETEQAQSDLNKKNEEQSIWDDKSKTAAAMAVTGLGAAAAAASIAWASGAIQAGAAAGQ